MKLSETFPPSLKEKIVQWILSFYHLDPRYQILKFFNLVAKEGADNIAQDSDEEDDVSYHNNTNSNQNNNPFMNRPSAARIRPSTAQLLASIFDATSILTVWRPCSNDAMRKMMEGTGVGKGLDIKGKSAKKGLLSAYVPFLQIHQEEHKKEIQPIPKNADMRIYYKTIQQRDYVYDYLYQYGQDRAAAADSILGNTGNTRSSVASTSSTTSTSPLNTRSSYIFHFRMKKIDKYSHSNWFGVEAPQRLFWNATVKPASIERPPTLKTGRPSTPGFQDANMKTLKQAMAQAKNFKTLDRRHTKPIPVVVQTLELSEETMERIQEQRQGQQQKTGQQHRRR